MDAFTINAVVLREVRYKEADAIVTLLTAEKGIITASVKGIYRKWIILESALRGKNIFRSIREKNFYKI